jgi:glycosidase
VGALWLSPVLYNPQWFGDYWGGYGITDFLRIEPRFCKDPAEALKDPVLADREFRDLVDAAHSQGIYVILDIVLNHVGDPFNYEGMRDSAPWRENGEYEVFWRDNGGTPQGNWTGVETISAKSRANGIWPQELQRNDYFRRKGSVNDAGDITRGDFDRLKELVTEYLDDEKYPVRNHLIRSYQYLIAKFDLDGFRIDTLQYVEPDFARVFGNAMREFGLSIGKKNFFTFGEVWQDNNEAAIARFIGRNTLKDEDIIGVDAAIDFPMRKRLCDVIKCNAAPKVLADQFDERRKTLKTIVSSQGDAGKNYVAFLDNHYLNERFHQQGVLAFSRILNDRELVVVVNTHTTATLTVAVVVDANLNPLSSTWKLLFSTADPGAGDQSPLDPRHRLLIRPTDRAAAFEAFDVVAAVEAVVAASGRDHGVQPGASPPLRLPCQLEVGRHRHPGVIG